MNYHDEAPYMVQHLHSLHCQSEHQNQEAGGGGGGGGGEEREVTVICNSKLGLLSLVLEQIKH